jgi:cell wall-associated NlpC family hydrolase
MGLRVPPCRVWCGAFVHQAFLRAGVRLSKRLIDPDRSYRDAKAHRRHLRAIPIRSVRRGDLLFFAFRQGLLASHFAIVRSRPRNGSVATVEGNVSNASRLEVRGLAYPVLAARVTG